MPEPRAHAIVVCPLKTDVAARLSMWPPAVEYAGKCISCGRGCYVNKLGASAIRERDADVCCVYCEREYEADINRSLIES